MMRLLRAAVAVLIVMGLVGAGLVFLTRRTFEMDAYPEGAIASPPTIDAPEAGLKFSILPTATLTAPEGAMFEGGNWLKQRTMNHSAVLICHPRGFVLFDTGLGRAIDSQFREFPLLTRRAFGYRQLTPAADVIAKANPCPGRPLIIPSHLHWDHAGGIEDFPDAEIVGVHRLLARDPELIMIPAHDAAVYLANAVYPHWEGHQE
ncbi:MAG: MBL fold metallo-hydrolase [Micropepsaceae bacterium]